MITNIMEKLGWKHFMTKYGKKFYQKSCCDGLAVEYICLITDEEVSKILSQKNTQNDK